jgi:hypothetical protein
MTLRTRLLRSITEMLGAQNAHPADSYEWVWARWADAPITDLARMQAGWMRNYPEIHAQHGIYVM